MGRKSRVHFGLVFIYLLLICIGSVLSASIPLAIIISANQNQNQNQDQEFSAKQFAGAGCAAVVINEKGQDIYERPTPKSKVLGYYRYKQRTIVSDVQTHGADVESITMWYKTDKGWIPGRYVTFDCSQRQDKNQ